MRGLEPTAGKLVGALGLAITGFMASHQFQISPVRAESQYEIMFGVINAGIGVLVGWIVIGRNLRGRLDKIIGLGLWAIFWFYFWSLLVFSMDEMLARSWRMAYEMPDEAFDDMIRIAWRFMRDVFQVAVMGVLILGGIATAALANLAQRLWS